jgi:WD40 repeat protein
VSAAPPPLTTFLCADCGKPLPANHAGAVCRACLWADPDEVELPEIKPGGLSLRIPGHDVESEIARGGMGIVYRAWEREAARHVALKMLLPHLADETGMRERFRLEARAVAALDHPSVLPVYHIGVADEVPYFTMKLADGGSLLERRDRYAGRWREIASLVASLAEAVHFAHTHGVLHRDLKPGNVLFDDKDRPYLSDFGLVKIVDSESHLTRSRHFLGTPHYAAPEVAASSASEATMASDVWSLGAMLYELLAGRLPFEAAGIPALLRKVVDDPAPPLPQEVPRDLAVICLKCLQKLPRQRFTSAGELAGDLRRWLEGRSISARPMSRTERAWAWSRRNPALAGLGAGLFAALAITAAALWRENTANVRALEESRNSETISRRAEVTARTAQAASLLEEARAIRRGGRLLDREAAIRAVLRSRALQPTSESRDELTTLLTIPRLEVIGSLPYTRRWCPPVDGGITRYATLEENDSVAVRDAVTQRILWQAPAVALPGYRPGQLSPDGRMLAVREESRTSVWEEGKDVPLLTLEGLRGEPKFSPDGHLLAVGGGGFPVSICNLKASPPTVVQCMDGETGWFSGAFSPDHRFLTAHQSPRYGLRVLNTATGQVAVECAAGRSSLAEFSAVQCASWSRRGEFFIAGTRDGSLARWSVGETQPEWNIPAHAGAVDGVGIAADDRLLVSQGRDGLVKFTNLLTLESLGSAPWAGIAIAVSSDGTRVGIDRVESSRMELLSCEAPASSEAGVLPPSRDQNAFTALHRNARVLAWPDGSRFAVSSGVDVSVFDSNSVRRPGASQFIGRLNDLVLDFHGGRWLRRENDKWFVVPPTLPHVMEPPEFLLTRMAESCAAYDPLSRRVLLGHRRGFSLYDFTLKGEGFQPKRESVKPWSLPGDRDVAVSAVAWSPDGKLVAWVGTDSRETDEETKAPPRYRGQPVLHVFAPAEGGAEKLSIVLPEVAPAIAFVSGDEAVVAVDGTNVACYELQGGRQRWRRPHRRTTREPAQLAAARNAASIAVTLDPHTISLLRPATGEVILTLTHPQERTIQAMDLTPDGTRLLALTGNMVQLWRIDVLQQEVAHYLSDAPNH